MRPRSPDAGSSTSSCLLALVGEGIEASLTPPMQEREGHEHGIDLTYRRVDTLGTGIGRDELPDLVARLRDEGYDGFNVTHPFKQAVVALLDDVSEQAADLGSVNTVLVHDGRLLGRNTDWSGFAQALSEGLSESLSESPPAEATDPVLVVGGGGAGVSVGYGLLHLGFPHVVIADLDVQRAADCVVRLGKRFGDDRVSVADDLRKELERAAGVVNATPVGMRGHPGTPFAADLLSPDQWVSDIVYFPLETQLVAAARARGCRVVTGGGMAVHQAVEAFTLFTGRPADPSRMRRHFAELAA